MFAVVLRGPLMEEVIELLRERCEATPVPLELPDEEVLVEIQEEILLHIPYDLRQFLLTVSDVVYGSIEPVTASDPNSHTYLPEVTALAWEQGLPRYLVPVCDTGSLIYASDPDGIIYAWDYATQELTDEEWESIWDWCSEVWLNA